MAELSFRHSRWLPRRRGTLKMAGADVDALKMAAAVSRTLKMAAADADALKMAAAAPRDTKDGRR